MQVGLAFIADHAMALGIAVAALIVYFLAELILVYFFGPKDSTGNGITVGHAKAFDNRSLQLRIERLGKSLTELKVINQKFTENLATLQGETSSKLTGSLTAEMKATHSKGTDWVEKSEKPKEDEKDSRWKSMSLKGTGSADSMPRLGIAASDLLSDQLNLASQILNLEMLYERSLTDRLIGDGARLQAVLGFQVSITPPAGYERCVAVVEIAVRVKGNNNPISLIALIPQEKNYNEGSLRTSPHLIGGSAEASKLMLVLHGKGDSQQRFIRRDPDTIAFERAPDSKPTLFDDDARAMVFGWEFRPVLGRSTVSAGVRQMLAVVAIPTDDKEDRERVTVETKTRTYWRRYSPRWQTTHRKWRWLPMHVDGSNTRPSDMRELEVPNTAAIENALAPKIAEIQWVKSGERRATVIVKGSNFFPGSNVLIGGTRYREEDGNLTLKSDHDLEFNISIEALLTGDAVLSGRFGSSLKLEVPRAMRHVGLHVTRAEIRPTPVPKKSRISLDVEGVNESGEYVDFTAKDLEELPDPLLFVGEELVSVPYDYSDMPPKNDAGGSRGLGRIAVIHKNYVNIEAWVSDDIFIGNPLIKFRVPFCGTDYIAMLPVCFGEPTITRMGPDGGKSVFRIAHPQGFHDVVSLELDRLYAEGTRELRRRNDFEIRFAIPTRIASQFQNVVLRIGKSKQYLLSIPVADKPRPKPLIDVNTKPPEIIAGSLGPVEWVGTDLDAIVDVTLHPGVQSALSGLKPTNVPTPGSKAKFATYAFGKRIEVYFSEGSTSLIGKAEVEFKTVAGDTLRVPMWIVKIH